MRYRTNTTAQEMTTPISRIVNINHQHMSATSSLTASHAASSLDIDALPSPKKAMTDFSRLKTDDDSVASGDDSTDWEKEDERMKLLLVAAGKAEDADDISEDDGPVNEVAEFMLMAGEDNNEEAAGDTIEPPLPEFEMIRVALNRGTSIAALKEIAAYLNLSGAAPKKDVLFNRIRDSPRVTKISETEFQYQRPKMGGSSVGHQTKIPTWILLTPEDVPTVGGIDMGTGAQRGFFGPTNKENAIGAKRSIFLTADDERIQRPKFGPKREKKRKAADDTADDAADDAADDEPPPPREDGHPSDYCRSLLPHISRARPKDYFDTQLTPEWLGWCTTATNLRAYSSGAGAGEYQDFMPFDLAEVYKMIGVLFANGLTPKPQFDHWFCSQEEEPLFGSTMISNALNRKNPVTGKTIKARRRWKHFRRYFTMKDYREVPREQQRKNPLWKVQRLIDELNKQAKDMWVPGIFVAIDEQTIGFQGQSGLKLRISYKQEGDGFQCDAVCDSGYTFSFYFRHGAPPDLDDKYKDLDLSPTARRVVWLAERLPNKWTRIFMDNLFNSQKLFTALHRTQALAHGVARTNGRGIPPSIIQWEEKNVKLAESLRGTTRAARLHNSDQCPDLFAVSVYDTKPVHILSTVAECVEWIVKERKVWDTTIQRKAMMKYLRLNVIEDYNQHMNSTDIADQLRGSYRPDRWMRQRKWWWAFFIWGIGVAGVNAYKIYEVIYAEEAAKGTPNLPPKLTHARFREELVYDFVFAGRSRRESLDSANSSGSSNRSFSVHHGDGDDDNEVFDLRSSGGRKDYCDMVKTKKITKAALEGGKFSRRLDGMRHNSIPARKHDHCQYCYFQLINEIPEKKRGDYPELRQNRSGYSPMFIVPC
jgi:hypothetical protein